MYSIDQDPEVALDGRWLKNLKFWWRYPQTGGTTDTISSLIIASTCKVGGGGGGGGGVRLAVSDVTAAVIYLTAWELLERSVELLMERPCGYERW